MPASTIIIVPCFNEASRLSVEAFRTFTQASPRVRFVCVDDGSTDHTWQLLAALQRYDPAHFTALRLPENRGKAAAVRSGVLQAFTLCPTAIGYWDADLATPLDAIPAFIHTLEAKPDIMVVCGVRLALLGRTITRHRGRQWVGWLFARIAARTLGLRLHDSQCGAKLFRATPETQALFREPFLQRWLLDVELFARLLQARRGTGLPPVKDGIYECPLDEWQEVPGSKVRAWDFLAGLGGLTRIWWHYRRGCPWS